LKRVGERAPELGAGRAPRGARGLKPAQVALRRVHESSRPARGARIETNPEDEAELAQVVAPRAGRAD